MIVNTYEEAIPIVQEQISKGKKIGQFSMGGPFHPGYQALEKELRKTCDYIICQCPFKNKGYDDNEYLWLSLWPGTKSVYQFSSEYRNITEEMALDVEKKVDLVIRENRPFCSPDKVKEIIDFTETYYINPCLQELPKYERENINFHLRATYFASLYYINTYFFQIDAKASSYKEGLWRFINTRLYKTHLGTDYPLIEPIRDEYGICCSSTDSLDKTPEGMKKKHILSKLLNGKPLVESKNETYETLQQKVFKMAWVVEKFERYEGPLLAGQEDKGDVYIFVTIASEDHKYRYSDGFLLKE